MKKYHKIRTEIKKLSQEQKELKPQRKTIYFKGTRTIDSDKAQMVVLSNTDKLMHLFIAYAKMKNIVIDQPKYKEVSTSLITKLIEEYTPIESDLI